MKNFESSPYREKINKKEKTKTQPKRRQEKMTKLSLKAAREFKYSMSF
jgi:hypothetical protein